MGCGSSIGSSSIITEESFSIDKHPADDMYSNGNSVTPPDERTEELIKDAKNEWKIFENPSNIISFSEDYIQVVTKINISYKSILKGHYQYLRLLADSGAIQVFCDQVMQAMQVGGENGKVDKNIDMLLCQALHVLTSFTDCVKELKIELLS